MPPPKFSLKLSGLLFIAAVFLSAPRSRAQLLILLEKEKVIVGSTDFYRSEHVVSGSNTSSELAGLAFQLSQTEKLEDIQTEVTVNGKTKKIDPRKNMSTSTMDWSAFFTGSTTYRIQIPANCTFTLRYTTTNNNTLFLSVLSRKGGYHAVLYQYEVTLPESLQMTSSNGKVYTGSMKLDTADFKKDQENIFTLVHQKGTDPQTYFSGVFEQYLDTLTTVEGKPMPAELEQLNAEEKRDELAAACFRYVQDKITYISIENGINALVPRPARHTLSTGLGDCKDMANLLCALLRHYGFESYLGISRTNTRKDALAFPSIALANHMIVALKHNGRFIFLDATEDECLFGDPSYQILGTEAFLIGNKSGYFQNVEAVFATQPYFRQAYTFSDSGQNLTFCSGIEVGGKLNLVFDMLHKAGKDDKKSLKTILRDLYKFDIAIDSISQTKQSTYIVLSATVPQSAVIRLPSGTYIDFSLFPAPADWSRFLLGREQPPYASNYQIRSGQLVLPDKLLPSENIVFNEQSKAFDLAFTINSESIGTGKTIPVFWKKLITKPILLKL